MLEILFYPYGETGPVRDYLEGLETHKPAAFARLQTDLNALGVEGLRSPQLNIRPFGKGLWELKRLYDGIHYRLFFGVRHKSVWLLHSIEKKSAKTPKNHVDTARKRLGGLR